MFQTAVTPNDLWFLAQGAGWTLLITAIAMIGGTVLGVMFGVTRAVLPGWTTLPLGFVLDIFRSVPLLIQLILANSFIPILGLKATPFAVYPIVSHISMKSTVYPPSIEVDDAKTFYCSVKLTVTVMMTGTGTPLSSVGV